MPEESTFRKYACPKLKLLRLLLDNLFWILVRNCGIAQNSNCGIAKLEFRKRGIGQFSSKWLLRMIVQIVVFRAKLMRKERKILRFVPQKLRKSFANGNPIWNCKKYFSEILLQFVVLNNLIYRWQFETFLDKSRSIVFRIKSWCLIFTLLKVFGK